MWSLAEAVGTTAQMWLLHVQASFLSGTGAGAGHSCRKSHEILRSSVASWCITITSIKEFVSQLFPVQIKTNYMSVSSSMLTADGLFSPNFLQTL